MSAATAIRDLIAPLLPGWVLQYGRWEDKGPGQRYVVIRPAGGVAAELVRRPQFTVTFIASTSDSAFLASDAADVVIEAMRTSSGSLVHMQAGEAVPVLASDGRPMFEIAVSTITN